MNDDSLNLPDHHRHHHRLLLDHLVAGTVGSVLAVAFLFLEGLELLVASCLGASFFLANFISSLAGAAVAVRAAVWRAHGARAATPVLAGPATAAATAAPAATPATPT